MANGRVHTDLFQSALEIPERNGNDIMVLLKENVILKNHSEGHILHLGR